MKMRELPIAPRSQYRRRSTGGREGQQAFPFSLPVDHASADRLLIEDASGIWTCDGACPHRGEALGFWGKAGSRAGSILCLKHNKEFDSSELDSRSAWVDEAGWVIEVMNDE